MSCDEEYQAAKLHEMVAHDKLMEILTDQQKELLEDFTTAASETDANAERIIYQQGMKDLYALIMALAQHKRANNCPFCILSLCNFFH